MTIYRKPRKSPLNDFVSMIVPDRIEEAFDRVDGYFTEHLKLSFDAPEGVNGVLDELIRNHGDSVRKALYSVLCDEDSSIRPLISTATGNGVKSVVGLVVPLLTAQFALAPAIALLVATLLIKAFASKGEGALCEALIPYNRKAAKQKEERERNRVKQSASRTTSSRRKSDAAKTTEQKRTPAGRPAVAKSPRPASRSRQGSDAGTSTPARRKRAPKTDVS